MSRSRTCRAIVLRSVDVGEADRFYILLTRELGRVVARANGVRKLESRFHALQMGSVLTLELAERSKGHQITGAHSEPHAIASADVTAFARSHEGMELLLVLVHEAEPSSVLFDDAARFLVLCHAEADPVPAFTLRTLSLLGLLPRTEEDRRFRALDQEAKAAVMHCAGPEWHEHVGCCTPRARAFAEAVMREQLSHPLKAGDVARSLLV